MNPFLVPSVLNMASYSCSELIGDLEPYVSIGIGISHTDKSLLLLEGKSGRQSNCSIASCRAINRNQISSSPVAEYPLQRKSKTAKNGTYKQGCDEKVQLAAGNIFTQFIGTGSLKFGNLQIPNAVLVESLNGTLVFVGDICDRGKIVVFSTECAIVLNT